MAGEPAGRPFDPLLVVARSWRLVVVAAVLGALALAAAALVSPTTYASEAAVLWQPDGGQSLPGASTATAGDAERTLSTQVDVVFGDAVMTSAAAVLGTDVADLRAATDVQVRQGADVLLVSVSGRSPEQARDRAAAVVESYATQNQAQGLAVLTGRADALQAPIDAVEQRVEGITGTDATTEARRSALVAQLSDLLRQQDELRAAADAYTGQVAVLSAADSPEEPSSLGVPLALVLGGGLGLVVGVLLALVRGLRRVDGAGS